MSALQRAQHHEFPPETSRRQARLGKSVIGLDKERCFLTWSCVSSCFRTLGAFIMIKKQYSQVVGLSMRLFLKHIKVYPICTRLNETVSCNKLPLFRKSIQTVKLQTKVSVLLEYEIFYNLRCKVHSFWYFGPINGITYLFTIFTWKCLPAPGDCH